MKKFALVVSLLFVLTFSLQSQIINGTDTLYGNEWINFDQSYFKVMVAEDGIYQLPYQALVDAGVPVGQIDGAQFQLFHNGEEIPIYTTTDGNFGTTDRIEFYGKKNTSELDRHLFVNPDEEMMNPRYSLFTDTSAYFLTWTESGNPRRYEEVANDLTNLPPKEEYFMSEQVLNLFSQHSKEGNSEGVRLSSFTMGEGYASNLTNVQTHNLTPVNPYLGGPDAKLHLRYSGNYGSHEHRISLNGQELTTVSYFGFQVRRDSFPVANNDLSGTLSVKFEGLVSNSDRHRVANIILEYPRDFSANGGSSFRFNLGPSTGKKYLEITDFDFPSGPVVAYDYKNGQRIQATEDNGILRLALPASNSARNLWLTNAAKAVSSISPIDFIDYSQIDADFIFLSNPKLYDDGNGNNYVQEYADYRASNEGGNYTPVIVDVQQVYDQFGWGLNRHSLSIRNFGHYVKREWDEVKYFFVVGKGREYARTRTSSALGNPNHLPLLIPTFGIPGSDNLLSANNWSSTPSIPIGRFPAVNPIEIKNYLQKMKAFERSVGLSQTIEKRLWMKRVMHLGGGGGSGEQRTIRNSLESMGNVLESNQFGAEVTSFYKTSSDPIQVSQTQAITDLINSGLSIMTFFGHSSATGFDFVVDDPSTYENTDKYPIVFSLGCFSGQIHDNFRSVGENFVIQEEKGAIAFIASTGFGYISALSTATSKFYDELGGNLYGQGIGNAMMETIAEIKDDGFANEVLGNQFTIQGDPSIVSNAFKGPDFTVDGNSISISPTQINAQQDNFTFSFTVVNIGKGVTDSLEIDVSRDLPNGSTLLVERVKIPSPKFKTDVVVSIPVLGERAVGFNRLYVKVDPDDKILEENYPEAEENNDLKINDNQIGVRFFVFSNGAFPIYPEEYSIVSDSEITLKASTSDAFAPSQKYYLEIDTTEHFNSPIRKTKSIQQIGGVVEWKPNMDWEDDRVYYWRIAPDSTVGQGFTWVTSSFLFLKNSKRGWNQSHYFQAKKNRFANMELPESTRELKFLDDVKTVRLLNGVYPTVWPSIIVNSESYFYLPWDNPVTGGMYITVLDSNTIDPLQNIPPGQYGSHLSPWAYFGTFPFRTKTAEQREKVINFLRDTVPSGNYVLLFTVQQANGNNYEPEEWAQDSLLFGTNLFQIFEEQGAKLIRGMETSGAMPYALMYKKDDPSFPVYEKAVGLEEAIEETFSLTGFWFSGNTESTLIGPAQSWDSLHWESEKFDPLNDLESVQIYGVKSDSTRVLLFEVEALKSLDISSINPSEYPYIKLKYTATDSIERTSPHLSYWRVLYEGLPDAAVNPEELFVFQKDTLNEGEDLIFEMAVNNLSDYDLDSLLTNFSISNEENQFLNLSKRIAPLIAQDNTTTKFKLNTKGLKGNQQFWFEVNPNLDQPERHTFNNIAINNFYVLEDASNPLMDVTFDGVRIINEDIVSPTPKIVISVEDENPFLPLNDTSYFKVFVQYPDTSELTYIPFDGQTLQFFPSENNSTEKNKARLEFTPDFFRDGTYNLIVQASDASNNAAGEYDYKVSFKVINKTSISNLLNYPNPFSTSTRFVYTLTGNEPPAEFKIQILTISGRIVREIGQDEIGPLKIGTHQTEYAWDGRDGFGDRLANGVYLYRIMAKKIDGEDFELFENSSTDKYFKNGYGKMVLIN